MFITEQIACSTSNSAQYDESFQTYNCRMLNEWVVKRVVIGIMNGKKIGEEEHEEDGWMV